MTSVIHILANAQAGVPYISATLLLVGMGAFFGLLLYVGSRAFAVEVDPRVDQVADALSGANCGACGYGGCRAYAEAVVTKGVATNLCAPGGQESCSRIAKIMGAAAASSVPRVAVVHCKGTAQVARSRGTYAGLRDCAAALVAGAGGGAKLCPNGCLGYGTCVAACPFGGLTMGPDGLPLVIERLCTGCGKCVAACPRGVIRLHPKSQQVFVLCSSHLKGKAQREACDAGCIGCKRCEKACPSDAIKVAEALASIDNAKCTQCGACVKVCPQGCIWDLAPARKAYAVAGAAADVAAACPRP
jgi:electron transport complex protein RnfB